MNTNQLPPHTMNTADHLPEPELGYIKTYKSNQPAFSARQMREAMQHALQANSQVQSDPSWWMRETDEGAEWTDTAPLVLSGWTPLYTAPQPAQATQPAEVTDEQILIANTPNGADCEPIISAPNVELIAFARSILALRPVQVPMTDEEITAIEESVWRMDWFDQTERESNREFVRAIEAHHGITAQAKKKEAP